jgi:hypothetical protein
MRVIVDFHSADGDVIWALKSHARDQLIFDDFGEGTVVLLDDTEGRTASGVLRSVSDEGLMEIAIVWPTWRDDSVYRPEPRVFDGYVPLTRDPKAATEAATELVPQLV